MDAYSLFTSQRRERLYRVVARSGPIPITSAFRAVGSKTSFEDASLWVGGTLRRIEFRGGRRVIAFLDRRHPLYAEVEALLTAIDRYDPEPLVVVRSDLNVEERRAIEKAPRVEYNLDFLCGFETRTRFLGALAALGGSAKVAEIAALAVSTPGIVRNTMRVLTKTGYVDEYRDNGVAAFRFKSNHPAYPEAYALFKAYAFLRSDLFTRDRLVLVRPTAKSKIPGEPDMYKWATTRIAGVIKPVGYEARAGGAPLLFLTDARFRVLAALATHGPMRQSTLLTAASTKDELLASLVALGFVEHYIYGNQRAYALSSTFPAAAEYAALLRKLAARFPLGAHPLPEDIPPPESDGPWRGDIHRLFGNEMGTLPMLALRSLGSAYLNSLSRLLPQSNIQEIRRTIYRLVQYGVVREAGKESGAILFAYDSRWFAAPELERLLDVVLAHWPVYRYERSLEESLLSPGRRRLRELNRNSKIDGDSLR